MVKILIVDDDKPTADRLSHFFDKEGHEAGCAYNGKEGLEVLTQSSPDIIFLDYNMPRINGLEFAIRVRTDPAYSIHSEIPIIGIGNFESADMDDNTRRLLTEYISKPLDLTELDRCIETYCG